MDRQISNETKVKQRRKKVITISGVVAVVLCLVLGFNSVLRPTLSKEDLLIARVERGDLRASLTAVATVIPEREEVIASPLQAKITKVNFNTGQQVSTGDTILILNTSQKEIELERQKDELQIRRNRLLQLKLDFEKKLAELQMQFKIKKLRVESLGKLVQEKRELLEIGGSTQDEIERTELDYEVAKLELEHLSVLIDNSKRSMQVQIRDNELEIAMQAKNIQVNQEILDQAQIIAKKPGVLTWVNDQVGTTVNIGADLVKISDLEYFKAEGQIAEMNVSELFVGGEVIIVSNEDSLTGKIGVIHPRVENRQVRFEIQLEDKSAEWLRPNLKTDAFVVTAFQQNVLKVENGSFYKGGTKNEAFVINGDRAEKVEIGFGESSLAEVELLTGVKEGQQVIISDMSKYEHLEYVNIK
ncbi:efflux RND transporter periplasmic adaptor subunit [Reichenbachiella versicolor]|uniref:efflux RND transporter periplasmic adaptor subunit n=1 Tax=Reichenbachiella versicolor TaxID=1821036 RepID=UPI000D6E382F|nr:biotin/lipoyl-binding protein [Reichenbachiella versicolor]